MHCVHFVQLHAPHVMLALCAAARHADWKTASQTMPSKTGKFRLVMYIMGTEKIPDNPAIPDVLLLTKKMVR